MTFETNPPIAEMARLGVEVNDLDPEARVLLLRLMGGDAPEYWLALTTFTSSLDTTTRGLCNGGLSIGPGHYEKA